MHAPHWSVLAAALSLSLAVGCSQGLAPVEEPHDGGINNHLGDGTISWPGNVQFDAGGGVTPGGGGGVVGADAGTSGGSGICGTDAATGDATLDACLDAMCCASFNACYADAACLACLADPSGAGCTSNNLLLAFDNCWANNCDTSGGGGGGTTGNGVCNSGESTGDDTLDACLSTSCCSSFTPCYGDAACLDCLYGTGTGCESNSMFLAFDGCWTSYCDSGSTGGGTTGNGVCDSGESTGDPTIDACLSGACCSEFDACYYDTSCADCMYGVGTACDSNATYVAFDDCWYYNCDY